MFLHGPKQTFLALISLVVSVVLLTSVAPCSHSACHPIQTFNSQFLLFPGMFRLWKMWLQWSKRAKGKSALFVSFSCLFQPQGIKSTGSQVSHCFQWRLAVPGSIAKARPCALSRVSEQQPSLCLWLQEGQGWGTGECPHCGVKPPAQCVTLPSLLPHPVGC